MILGKKISDVRDWPEGNIVKQKATVLNKRAYVIIINNSSDYLLFKRKLWITILSTLNIDIEFGTI